MATNVGSETVTNTSWLFGLATHPTTKWKVLTRRHVGFIVERGTPGFTSTVIKHKLALRPVENCNLYFDDVLLKE